MRIGFIGLGAMGAPMARNLLACRARGARLRPAGRRGRGARRRRWRRRGQSPREAARDAELLWLMVVIGDQAEAVLFGATAPPRAEARRASSSRLHPSAGAGTALWPSGWRRMGLAMLDAPVSGGVAGARTATLADDHAPARDGRVRPRAAGVRGRGDSASSTSAREAGLGSTAKMINQLLCGVHIAAAAEAMHVAERAGVSLQTMHEIISVSAGNSWMWGDRGPRMMQDDPPVASAVDIFVKDLGIVLDQGKL